MIGRQLTAPEWFRSWIKDSGISLFAQAGSTIVTTILAVIIARQLPTSDLGIFFAVFGVAQALALFVDIGMATWLLRELSRAVESDVLTAGTKVSAVLANCLSLNLALTVAVGIIAAAVGRGPELTVAVLALVIYSGLVATALNLETVLRARREISWVAFSNISEKIVILIGVVVAVTVSGSVASISLAYLLGGVVRLAIPTLLVRRRVPLSRPTYAESLSAIKGSIPFGLSAASLSLVSRLDVAVVATFSTVSAAYFAVGDRLVGALLVIPAATSVTLYPFLAKPQNRSLASLLGIVALFFSAGLAIAVIGISVAPQVVDALFGRKYEPATDAVRVMLAVLPFVFASSALIACLYTVGREVRVAATVGVAVAVGLLGVVIGQHLYGTIGAASGYLLRQILIVTGLLGQLILAVRTPGALRMTAGVDAEQLLVDEENLSGS